MTINSRKNHIHVLGSTGSGKSKFLSWLIRNDIENGTGACVIDPHGKLIDEVLSWSASNIYRQKIQLIDFRDERSLPTFNPLDTKGSSASFVTERTIDAFLSVFGAESSNQTPLLERVMRATFRVLAENNSPLTDALRLAYRDEPFIASLLHNTKDLMARYDWSAFLEMSNRDFTHHFHSFHNRLSRFLSNEYLWHCFSSSTETLDIRKVMDSGTTLLVNLAPNPNLHASQAKLFGTLLVNEIYTRSFERDEDSPRFHLYIDECGKYVSVEMAGVLEECRKRRIFMTLAHQTLYQLQESGVYEAVMGNARTKVVFGGLYYDDARVMTENTQFLALAQDSIPHILDRPTVVGYERVFMSGGSDSHGEATNEPAPGSDGDTRLTTSANATHSFTETNAPQLEWLPTTLRNVEDKKVKLIATLLALPEGLALMKPAQVAQPHFFKTPFIPKPFIRKDRLLSYRQKVLFESPFACAIQQDTRISQVKTQRESFRFYEDNRDDNDDFSA